MEWILVNWDLMLEALFGIMSVASIIVKLTPSPKDDEILKRVLHWVSFLRPRGDGIFKMPMTK